MTPIGVFTPLSPLHFLLVLLDVEHSNIKNKSNARHKYFIRVLIFIVITNNKTLKQ